MAADHAAENCAEGLLSQLSPCWSDVYSSSLKSHYVAFFLSSDTRTIET